MCWLQIPLLLRNVADRVGNLEICQPATWALQKNVWYKVLNCKVEIFSIALDDDLVIKLWSWCAHLGHRTYAQDIIYIYVVVYVCIMSLVATQLLFFLSCGACCGPDSKKRVSTFFWDTRGGGGHGPDSLHKFKSSRRPDKILSQAGFGPRVGLWTCLPKLIKAKVINIYWMNDINRISIITFSKVQFLNDA